VPEADRPEPELPAPPHPDATATGPAALKPLDVDGIGAILYGTIAWALAWVLCLLLWDRLAADGRSWWAWACLVGALLGLAGLVFARRRAAVYRAAAR
jgi:hypothetical protein